MMLTAVLVFALVAAMVGCVALTVYDPVRAGVDGYLHQKTAWATGELDAMFVDVAAKRLRFSFLIGPVVGAALGWVVLRSVMGLIIGVVAGLLLPQLYIVRMKARRQQQFQGQLVDTLMLMSSSLKAGLSILQAFEVVADEMPPPISQEFGLVLKENKMGMPIQETLLRIKTRMPSDDLNLVVTAVLVARETGGDVTAVFSRLIETLRERRKLKERVKTLTIQSRIQGIVMMILPVAFAFFAYSFNKEFFQVFFTDALGRVLLMLAVALELLGAFLIWLFGRVPV